MTNKLNSQNDWQHLRDISHSNAIARHYISAFERGLLSKEDAAIGMAKTAIAECEQLREQLKTVLMRQSPPPIMVTVDQQRFDEINASVTQKSPTYFLLKLAQLCEDYKATITYTSSDDGTHIRVDGKDIFVGYLDDHDAATVLRKAISDRGFERAND